MSEIKRYHIIQAFIDKIKERKPAVNYVEIGVQTGFCFFKIKADRKVAVDPNFIIKPTKKLKAYLRNFSNFRNVFFEITSDEFFEKKAQYLAEIGGIDVIFIDGLHMHEQVVVDVENALRFLNTGGVVLMHDCNPISAAAAARAYSPKELWANPPEGWTGEWNGDTWKALVELRSRRKDLQIAVFDCDYGIGYVTPGSPENTLAYSSEEVKALSYDDLATERTRLLNLKPADAYKTYLEAI
ncbi:class I SAM-dependent methyltransferase [Pedobacter sp. SYSU D00535]|uniref:class I SAM-dependent methyltransferase n=1 Tax=Pedobacter sp. SYSU D00535 TaxID=2810308 RepID=UPI001A977F4C|nr:class I SAM-dependent methyltransferase [Pedobacter sp. SYSU D00535]